MKPGGFFVLVFVAFVSALGGRALATVCAPAKLVHIRVVNITPGVGANSFGAAPKDFYRVSNGKLRIEEAPDPANHIHGLIVNNEPDMWFVNLYDHTGKHGIDPGPTFNSKSPILGLDVPKSLMDLEFGCEPEFIAKYAPTPVRTESVNGASYRVYRFAQGEDAVELLVRAGSKTPTYVRGYKNGTLDLALRYDLYQTGLPSNPALFAKPAGIQFTEGP